MSRIGAMGTLALIGLGSNLGDRKATMDAAVAALAAAPGVELRAMSPYHATAPVGGPPGQGSFLNAAAAVETSLDPFELLRILREIEAQAGRVRVVRWGERTLDLDLLLFGDWIVDSPDLVVPHPRMAVRRFVLAPLAQIAPEAVDPLTGRTVASLLANLDRRPSYVALAGPAGPTRDRVFRGLVEALGGIALTAGEAAPCADEGASNPSACNAPWGPAFATWYGPLDRELACGRWSAPATPDRWLVSDSWFDLIALALFRGHPHPARVRSLDDQFARARATVLPPTFVVALGGLVDRYKKSGVNRERTEIHILWPAADDPDTILADALAACAASRP